MIFSCETCNKNLSCNSSLVRHYKSKQHEKNLENIKLKNKHRNAKKFKIQLKNKKGNVVGETKVDKAVYFHIMDNNYTVNLSNQGYARITIKYTSYSLHRYIYYTFYKNTNKRNRVIDHNNSNKLDNRLKNLNQVTYEINNRNKRKSKNATSRYYGVSYDNTKKMWRFRFVYKKHDIRHYYDNEVHAAYHYDLCVKGFNLDKQIPINNIKKPIDFIMVHKNIKTKTLAKYVFKHGKNYYGYSLHCKRYYPFDTVADALKDRNKKIKKEEKLLLSKPILRNKKGKAIIELHNKYKVKVAETIVDDKDYYKLKRYSWWFNTNTYVVGKINKKSLLLSRFIMNCPKNKIVDHINGNRLDNRKSNLRIITRAENAQNKLSKINGSSKYIGVSYNKNLSQWKASITYNRTEMYLGRYSTELEAVHARDIKAKELNKTFGTYYKINL